MNPCSFCGRRVCTVERKTRFGLVLYECHACWADAGAVYLAGAGLSVREREVARRVAAGLTNQEIGTALHVSPHTVKSHVSHILRKLGVANRAQLATLVSTHAR